MQVQKLHRLTEENITKLSRAMLGEAGGLPHVVDLLQRETEGNVFFLVEVVRALAEDVGQLEDIGRATLPQQVLAGGVQRIVQRRLERVPKDRRLLLELAAVIGRQLDLKLLRSLMPETDLEQWLTDCANVAVLDVFEDQWRFAHDKLRDGVLSNLTETELQVLHRRVAQAIEKTYPDSPQHIIALAHHWGKVKDEAKEEYYITLAGRQALTTGAYREAASYLQRALALVANATTQGDAETQRRKEIEIRNKLGESYLGFGHYETAREVYQENLQACETLKDKRAIADTQSKLGDVALALTDYDEANARYNECLSLYKELESQPNIARVLNSIGHVAYEQGDQTKAKALFQESLSLSREIGGQWGMAGSLSQTGSATREHERARQSLQSALIKFRESNNQRGVAETLRDLGIIAHEQKDFKEADELFTKSLSIYRELNDTAGIVQSLTRLGLIASAMGNYDVARDYLRDALRTTLTMKDTPLALQILDNFARVLAAEGQKERAVELVAFVIYNPTSTVATQDDAERLLAELESALPSDKMQAAWEKGKTRQFDHITGEILGTPAR
jgi:tetratricopeptide (TPR) repeat protein